MARTVDWEKRDLKEFLRNVDHLRSVAAAELKFRGGMASGDTIDNHSINYFAVLNVVEFIEDAVNDLEALVKIRNIVKRMKTGSG